MGLENNGKCHLYGFKCEMLSKETVDRGKKEER